MKTLSSIVAALVLSACGAAAPTQNLRTAVDSGNDAEDQASAEFGLLSDWTYSSANLMIPGVLGIKFGGCKIGNQALSAVMSTINEQGKKLTGINLVPCGEISLAKSRQYRGVKIGYQYRAGTATITGSFNTNHGKCALPHTVIADTNVASSIRRFLSKPAGKITDLVFANECAEVPSPGPGPGTQTVTESLTVKFAYSQTGSAPLPAKPSGNLTYLFTRNKVLHNATTYFANGFAQFSVTGDLNTQVLIKQMVIDGKTVVPNGAIQNWGPLDRNPYNNHTTLILRR